MKILLLIIAFVLLIILILLFKPTVVEVAISDGKTVVKVGGKRVKIKFYDSTSQKKVTTENKSGKKNNRFKLLKKRIKTVKEIYSDEKGNIKTVLIYLKNRIKINNIDFALKFGLGDAALTGIANGAIWSVLTLIINKIDKH